MASTMVVAERDQSLCSRAGTAQLMAISATSTDTRTASIPLRSLPSITEAFILIIQSLAQPI
jgi:hypothetical protein